MDEEKEYYMVYRMYSNKERPGVKENSHIYGWTNNKNILKGFFKQRDERKYLVVKMRMVEIEELVCSHSYEGTGDYMIDYTKLKSSKTQEEFSLFMTVNEMREVERGVQRIFEDLSALDKINADDILSYVNMVLNLDQKYYDALFYLGYRPKEIEGLFDSDMCICDKVPWEGMPCEEFYQPRVVNDTPGGALKDVATKIIYSIESFIKVMRKDL